MKPPARHEWRGSVHARLWDLGPDEPFGGRVIEIRSLKADHYAMAVIHALSSAVARLRIENPGVAWEIDEFHLYRIRGGPDDTPTVDESSKSSPHPDPGDRSPRGGAADRSRDDGAGSQPSQGQP